MTLEEAMRYLECANTTVEQIEMPFKTLGQGPVLDKIRAEIDIERKG